VFSSLSTSFLLAAFKCVALNDLRMRAVLHYGSRGSFALRKWHLQYISKQMCVLWKDFHSRLDITLGVNNPLLGVCLYIKRRRAKLNELAHTDAADFESRPSQQTARSFSARDVGIP
jgi:hypothetical protein